MPCGPLYHLTVEVMNQTDLSPITIVIWGPELCLLHKDPSKPVTCIQGCLATSLGLCTV